MYLARMSQWTLTLRAPWWWSVRPWSAKGVSWINARNTIQEVDILCAMGVICIRTRSKCWRSGSWIGRPARKLLTTKNYRTWQCPPADQNTCRARHTVTRIQNLQIAWGSCGQQVTKNIPQVTVKASFLRNRQEEMTGSKISSKNRIRMHNNWDQNYLESLELTPTHAY